MAERIRFTAGPCELPGYPDGEGHGAAVFGPDGNPFCYVSPDDTVHDAAVERAQDIADALNAATGLTNEQLRVWAEDAKRDDWHERFVGSDIRGLIGEVMRHRAADRLLEKR